MISVVIEGQNRIKTVSRKFTLRANAIPAALQRAVEKSTILAYVGVLSMTPTKTGRLRRSIGKEVSALRGVVYQDEIIAPYGQIVELGAKKHKIVAKEGKPLRFLVNGRFQYARTVRHPGFKGRKMFTQAREKLRKAIRLIFERETTTAMKK